ncbi:hypothetical protein DRQ25_13315 [Candidatus Fermentibacteria bacterium]|nr:MAG: hypothetical protein DRQ25_13315 [Candidatus Fermentibacteria bacterium]
MDKEIWVVVAAGMIPGVISLTSQVAGIFAARKETSASAEKDDADAAAILSGAALKLYEAVQDDLTALKVETRQLRTENIDFRSAIAGLKHELEIANSAVEYLLMGIGVLTNQMADLDIEPEFRPRKNFRGGDALPFAQRKD